MTLKPHELALTETADGWTVSERRGESVYPQTSYPTARLAVARILQLLDLGPVGPQKHPERICIGFVEYAK